MNERFQFSFADIEEKKLIKKCKELKSKNKYTLKEIEHLIEWIQVNWNSPVTITVVCDDTEEGISYGYNNIDITPFSMGGKKILMLGEIEKQTLNAEEIKDPNKLILNINRQYQLEEDIKENPESSKQKKKSNFSLSSLSFIKRKNITDNEKNIELKDELEVLKDIDVEKDFEEIDSDQEQQIKSEKVSKDFPTQEIKPVPVDPVLVDHEEEIDFEDEEDIGSNNKKNLSDDILHVEESSYKSIESENSRESEMIEPKLLIKKKHETVQFETYDKYLDLGTDIDNLISEMNSKLRPENLKKFIGISSTGITNTKIEDRISLYVNQCLNEAKFEKLREEYRIKTNEIKENVIERLDEAFEKAMLENYENEACEEKNEELTLINSEIEIKINNFEKEQLEISENKIKKLNAKQEMELQAFVGQQKAELDLFIATEQERIRNIIENYKESLNDSKNKQYEEIIDNAMYTIKSRYSRELLEGKRKMKQLGSNEIQNINNEIWSTAQEYINEIKNDISKNMKTWVEEIKDLNLLEEQEHQRKLQEEEMLLKKEQNEIARLKAEADLTRQKKLEQDNEMLTIQLEKERSKCELLQMKISLGEPHKNKVNEEKKPKRNFLSMFF